VGGRKAWLDRALHAFDRDKTAFDLSMHVSIDLGRVAADPKPAA
jgi:hypothetical protein